MTAKGLFRSWEVIRSSWVLNASRSLSTDTSFKTNTQPVWVDSLEVYSVDAEGLITSVRAFWEPPSDPAVQAELALNQWGGGET